MKVAIICGTIPSTTFIENLIHSLASSGVKVNLIGKNKGEITYKSHLIRNYGTGGVLRNFLLFKKYLILLAIFKPSELSIIFKKSRNKGKSLYHFITKYGPLLWDKPDIIHIQWAREIEDWIWLKTFNIKVILSLRGTHINTSPLADNDLAKLYNKYFPEITAFHCVSDAIMKVGKKYSMDPENAMTIYSGVNINKMKDFRYAYAGRSKLKLLSVGRNHWKKGYNYSILSANLLKKSGVDFTYEIVSKESEENNYLINLLDLKNHVKFIGTLENVDVLKKMESSDLLLLPSVEEGIANVVLEAMAIGLLVISTNCGGMSEVVKNRYNGLLIEPRSPKDMFKAIKLISSLSYSEKLKMRANAKETILTQHNMQDSIRKFCELYKKSLN